MEHFISFLGLLFILAIAWLFSENKKKINYRSISMGIAFQFILAIIVLWSRPGKLFFSSANDFVVAIIGYSNEGARMVFGDKFQDHFFAFAVLPSIIFFSALMAVLFYAGVMQKIVRAYSWVVHKAMNVSGAEAMAASANVFVGGMESAFTIRPYVNTMTRSEMFALLTAGMATIAGGVLGAYASMGMDAGHLISAQLLSAVGSLVIAKIMIPETESPLTLGNVNIKSDTEDKNIFDAACRGALEGTRVVACVAGILIAFVAITAMINGGLSLLPQIADEALTVERILGWIFTPVVFLTGVPWEDCGTLGGLLGKKMFLNEFLAYIDLAQAKEHVNPRSFMLATYFLCGFANFSVVAMQIGGMGSVFPEKRAIVVELGMKCLFAGTLATLMSACIAGILL